MCLFDADPRVLELCPTTLVLFSSAHLHAVDSNPDWKYVDYSSDYHAGDYSKPIAELIYFLG